MAYTPYVTPEEYASFGYTLIPECERYSLLKKASRHIDTLTFNRIHAEGFDNLTEFQSETIKEVVCQQAEFEYDNEEIINTILQSYSVNGVSMSFGQSWNVYVENGVAIKKDIYGLLCQTGYCCRLV